jgi:hypothetical protein
MNLIRTTALLASLTIVGCKNKGGAEFGDGPENDARFLADVYTWQCEEGGTNFYEGVFGFDVSLEVAPDALVPRSLPAPGGCSADLSMFGADPNGERANIPEISDEPRWASEIDSGELENVSDGWYYDEVFDNVHNCQTADALLSGGIELLDAGSLTGAVTPDPGSINDVTMVSASDYEQTGFEFGEEIDITWDAEGWDEAWIQVRRERNGEAWEYVTCNASGYDGFTLDDNVWGMMTENLGDVFNNVYVAFQNHGMQEMEDGQKVEVATRAMHVAVAFE